MAGGFRERLAAAIRTLHDAEAGLADDFRAVGDLHDADRELAGECERLAGECDALAAGLRPVAERYGVRVLRDEGESVFESAVGAVRRRIRDDAAPAGLLRDLRDLLAAAVVVGVDWDVAELAAEITGDADLGEAVAEGRPRTAEHVEWVRGHLDAVARASFG